MQNLLKPLHKQTTENRDHPTSSSCFSNSTLSFPSSHTILSNKTPKKTLVSQKGFTKTATSRLQDFGIQLISDFDIYFYSKMKTEVRLEDVILHILLVERGSVRYATYSLLLLKKEQNIIDNDYLLKRAIWYDLSLQINAMLEFLRTRGARTLSGLPTWNEFIAKMSEYNIEAVA
jgi:hypothetical protein